MLGVINLFITILKDPVSLSADSDLALMDMVAGHFAHLEFLTSAEFTYPFAREVAAVARATVKKERENSFAYSDTAAGGARMGLSLESDVPDFWNYVSSNPFHSNDYQLIISRTLDRLTFSMVRNLTLRAGISSL